MQLEPAWNHVFHRSHASICENIGGHANNLHDHSAWYIVDC